MAKLAGDLKERYEITAIAIHHRVGRVEIGEPSVVIAVSAAHRRDARSPRARTRSTSSRWTSRSGRKRSTKAARSGSAAAPDPSHPKALNAGPPPPDTTSLMEPLAERDYEPIQPRGTDWRGIFRKLFAPLIFLIGLAAKLGSLAKFAAIFVAFGGYTLIWGWKFALGVIVLIFVHEMGHFLEAWREGLNPSWPVFIPFLGAYVKHTRGNPWQTARVAIAGPILGGRRRARLLRGRARQRLVAADRARLLRLLPQPDQPAAVRHPRRRLGLALDPLALARRRTREGARLGRLYFGTALLLAVGAYAAYIPQHRL